MYTESGEPFIPAYNAKIKEVEDLTLALQSAHAQLSEARLHIATLTKQLANIEKSKEGAQKKISSGERKVFSQQQTLNHQSAFLLEQQATIEAQQRWINEQYVTIETQQGWLGEQQTTIQTLQDTIQSLNAALLKAENQSLHHTLPTPATNQVTASLGSTLPPLSDDWNVDGLGQDLSRWLLSDMLDPACDSKV